MAGIFESQIMQGSSLRGESFTHGKATADPSQLIGAVGQAAEFVHDKTMFDKAKKEAAAGEEQYLYDQALNVSDNAEIERLKSIDPSQGAVYERATKQIKLYEDLIASRGVNPAEALSRREATLTKYIARAPLFATQIRNLTTANTTSFMEEASQRIKETKDLRDDVRKWNLNPDSPSDMIQYNMMKEAERMVFISSNTEKLTSEQASRLILPNIKNYVQQVMGVSTAAIVNNVGEISNLTEEQKFNSIAALDALDAKAESIVNDIIIKFEFNPGEVSKEDKEQMISIIKSEAALNRDLLNGKVQREIVENTEATAEAKLFQEIRHTHPAQWMGMKIVAKLPDSVATLFVDDRLGQDFKKIFMNTRGGDKDMFSKDKLSSWGISNITNVQRQVAKNMENAYKQQSNLSDPQPEQIKSWMDFVNTQVKEYTDNPESYVPENFDSMINMLNNLDAISMYQTYAPDKVDQFKEQTLSMIKSYTENKIEPALMVQLEKKIGFWQVRETVTPVVSDFGEIYFVPNTKKDMVLFNKKAEEQAEDLNNKYRARLSAIRRTGGPLFGLKDREQLREYNIRVFKETFDKVGLPLKLRASNYAPIPKSEEEM
jgi:hypothetical protein